MHNLLKQDVCATALRGPRAAAHELTLVDSHYFSNRVNSVTTWKTLRSLGIRLHIKNSVNRARILPLKQSNCDIVHRYSTRCLSITRSVVRVSMQNKVSTVAVHYFR